MAFSIKLLVATPPFNSPLSAMLTCWGRVHSTQQRMTTGNLILSEIIYTEFGMNVVLPRITSLPDRHILPLKAPISCQHNYLTGKPYTSITELTHLEELPQVYWVACMTIGVNGEHYKVLADVTLFEANSFSSSPFPENITRKFLLYVACLQTKILGINQESRYNESFVFISLTSTWR
jgi:hypothetical protein